MSRFYLDVDDVLVDFKGGAVAAGVPRWEGAFYANDPSTWTPEQRHAIETTDKLCADPLFWRGLQLTPWAFLLMSACALRGETFLLTAYPVNPAISRSMIYEEKMAFIVDRLHVPEKRIIVCERHEKSNYACDVVGSYHRSVVPNVLIDDAQKNVIEWRAAGGVAIHHDPEYVQGTIDKLRSAAK